MMKPAHRQNSRRRARCALALTGCQSSAAYGGCGPVRLQLGIADSWKQQTLLNIVKLRYLDLRFL